MLPRNANINLTLGMPLDKLQAGQLLHAATRTFKNYDKKAIYHRDLVRLLRHPFVHEWIASIGLAQQSDALLQSIAGENRIYVGTNFIARFFGENKDLTDWLTVPKNNTEMLERVAWLFETLCDFWDKSRPADQNYEREQTYAALHLIREAQNWVGRYFGDLSTRILCELIWQLAKGENISFRGEPETGIQIMGILETRLLHFDQVVMLSLNEDVVPKGKSQYSLIPQDVKKQFNLPWFTHRDAIFAYHFYHLFHGCNAADLVYTQGGSGIANAGPSRFLYQIEWEWTQFPSITFSKQLYFSPLLPETNRQNFAVLKTPELIAQLEERFVTKGISPSAIRSYLRDPMEFYRQYALGIREEDLFAEEEAGLPAIGIAVHSVLEDLYAPFVNRAFPDTETLRKMQKTGVKNVRAALQKELGEALLDMGKNIIALTAAEEMVYLAVQFDIDTGDANANRIILSLENGGEEIMYPLPLETPFGNIHLTGFIDRMEKWGDTYVYLDYKTGTVPNTLKWPEDPYAIEADKRYDKLGTGLQIMSYALLAGDQHKPFKGALIGLKKKNDGYRWLQIEKENTIAPEMREHFKNYLCDLICEMLYTNPAFEKAT
jgi:ATP-dependent helicase/nuclease subunit B